MEEVYNQHLRAPGVDVDDAALMHEGVRRIGAELGGAIAATRDWVEPGADGAARLAPVARLEAVADLFGLVGATPSSVGMATGIRAVVSALARCSACVPPPAVTVDATDAPIDGRVARAVHLVVLSLLAGRTAGGAIAGEGHVEVEARLARCGVEVTVRDFCDDPPDRVAVGGELLLRTLAATGGAIAQKYSPGLATTVVHVHQPHALAYAVAGNA